MPPKPAPADRRTASDPEEQTSGPCALLRREPQPQITPALRQRSRRDLAQMAQPPRLAATTHGPCLGADRPAAAMGGDPHRTPALRPSTSPAGQQPASSMVN